MATPLRALVVEDSEDDCMLLLSILRRGGYACARTTRVFTAAFVFACSLMALPHDPCCDRSTRTLAHCNRRKDTNHAQVFLFVRSVSRRKGTAASKPAQEGEEPRLPTFRILTAPNAKAKPPHSHSSLIANITAATLSHHSGAHGPRVASSSSVHCSPNNPASAAAPVPAARDLPLTG